MRDTALLVVALIVVYLGFALLAMSQDRHWHHLGGARHCPTRAAVPLRIGGCVLLVGALVLLLISGGPGFGSLLWATMLSLGALAVVGTLTWRPGWLRLVARLVQCVASNRSV